ncbi:MAG: ribosomal RNA small subunit methyltransferase A [Deltaproteobacteria bacterium]|jgi:16S rRNA (adenine1518-N6/adenine1519-N6)-dimethyltransferase|nr:ribosomal RNA small subunit methyltransferase A [Deltaproteobacteria bacterium]MBW2240240.1 ribosomal RNA small subunit methyltransferase A [Deltaproteobacteria bacterium]MBW2571293.1 ribosomal RNA small subunit methyltransferase A [Deltaproteobacteria bacterium]MBW2668336.1 ribosomal RNA small subunit methyltransferase A [Deltaproteobacteria bacterium]
MTSPRILLAAHNIRPKKQLGQNFIIDPAFTKMIVNRSGILPEDVVLEIGAGLGALTIPLARKAKKVFAVEKDQKIINILKTEILASGLSNTVIIEKNILTVDIEVLAENIGRKIVVMGNLPYNISSQILVQLVKSRKMVSRAILMFQKEMAQRISAQPDCKDYGRLAVMLSYCSDIKKLADAKASLFFPKPKVDSEILELRFKNKVVHPARDEAFFFRVIKAAFGNRRKTLKNALAASELNIDANTAKHILECSGIDPVRRAETLNTEEFVKLSNLLFNSYPT